MSKYRIYNKVTKTPDPVCGYKWGWSTINLMSARTNSCHRVEEDNIINDDISNFHNTPNKIKTRKDMLNGKWPGMGCEYCRDIEEAGGTSDRVDFNGREENLKFIPKEFETDNTSVVVSPTILEVYFSNLCNLGCVYCHPRYSSVLANESRKFKGTPWGIEGTMDFQTRASGYEARLSSFWKWFEENAHTLKRYNILGGEPFFQPEFYTNLEYLENTTLPELDFYIFSNLKINKDKLRNIAERLTELKLKGKVKSANLVCSIDCWGPQQEYVRTGLNMKSWEENFDMLVKEFPEIGLEMHGTITGLTIKTMPELLHRWKKWNTIRTNTGRIGVGLSHNFCFDPSYYSPFIFGPNFFDADFDKIYEVLEGNDYLLGMMEGYQKRINSSKARDKLLMQRLQDELMANDNRRKSDYREYFPWFTKNTLNWLKHE